MIQIEPQQLSNKCSSCDTRQLHINLIKVGKIVRFYLCDDCTTDAFNIIGNAISD